jgi:hypothetical protein
MRGTVYRPKGRNGQRTRFWWLMYRFPGETRRRRECTSPRTEDKREAQRQLNARLAERGYERHQRLQVEDLVVDDLLDLYVLECADHN